MAYLLPGLILLAGSVAAQTFSHAEALRTAKGCLPCHAPIPRSVLVSKSPARPVRWVKFSHARHVPLGVSAALIKAIDAKTHLGPIAPELRKQLETENVCQACHRGMGEVTGPLAKANYPSMSDCLVCHNRIDPPFSCEKCHVEDVKTLMPATHTAGFVDRHTSKGQEKASCAACHGRRFTCMGCH